ncbi:hypothetical protein HDU97_002457 [Phlyctochytrium planicorne]|nr:hypothetical protein HDU97_002457 [Phlyctochytrium planicorne]
MERTGFKLLKTDSMLSFKAVSPTPLVVTSHIECVKGDIADGNRLPCEVMAPATINFSSLKLPNVKCETTSNAVPEVPKGFSVRAASVKREGEGVNSITEPKAKMEDMKELDLAMLSVNTLESRQNASFLHPTELVISEAETISTVNEPKAFEGTSTTVEFSPTENTISTVATPFSTNSISHLTFPSSREKEFDFLASPEPSQKKNIPTPTFDTIQSETCLFATVESEFTPSTPCKLPAEPPMHSQVFVDSYPLRFMNLGQLSSHMGAFHATVTPLDSAKQTKDAEAPIQKLVEKDKPADLFHDISLSSIPESELPTLTALSTKAATPQSPPLSSSRSWTTPVEKHLYEVVNGRRRIYHLPALSKAPPPPPPRSFWISFLSFFGLLGILGSTSPKLRFHWEDVHTSSGKDHQQKLGRDWMSYLPGGVATWIRATFLPVGYPSTVHPVYARVHWLQAVETFVWSTVSVLCNQSMLESLGVSTSPAAAGGTAVAIQWVMKDGLGEIGKLFFIQRFARSFDSHPKTWKLVGEVASISGAILQLLTVVAGPGWFLVFASLGFALRSIHFSIYNATHMTFTRNFALQGNVGDLVAKDDSQMTIAHLLGMSTGVLLLYLSHSHLFLFLCFSLLAPVHFVATLYLVDAAKFEVLNRPRLLLICKGYVESALLMSDRGGIGGVKGRVMGVEGVEKYQRGFGEWLKKGVDVPRVMMGEEVLKCFENEDQMQVALNVLEGEHYLIGLRVRDGTFTLSYHQNATHLDVIKSLLHVTKLWTLLREHHPTVFRSSPDVPASPSPYLSMDDEMLGVDLFCRELVRSREWTCQAFPLLVAEMEVKKWETDAVFWEDGGKRAVWGRKGVDVDIEKMA